MCKAVCHLMLETALFRSHPVQIIEKYACLAQNDSTLLRIHALGPLFSSRVLPFFLIFNDIAILADE